MTGQLTLAEATKANLFSGWRVRTAGGAEQELWIGNTPANVNNKVVDATWNGRFWGIEQAGVGSAPLFISTIATSNVDEIIVQVGLPSCSLNPPPLPLNPPPLHLHRCHEQRRRDHRAGGAPFIWV
jgi:hypothetical protein